VRQRKQLHARAVRHDADQSLRARIAKRIVIVVVNKKPLQRSSSMRTPSSPTAITTLLGASSLLLLLDIAALLWQKNRNINGFDSNAIR
jgi:hypothetical protein